MTEPSTLSTDEIAELHGEAYSRASDYYLTLTDSMRQVRQEVLARVLDDRGLATAEAWGPAPIGKPVAAPLSKDSAILDVGCATGDNLGLMREAGFQNLAGLDISPAMIQKASRRFDAKWICDDFFQFQPKSPYDLVFAQAFVHLFPKGLLGSVFQRLLSWSCHRVYFSTTLHDASREGLEPKGDVTRYRSRYTLSEILSHAQEILRKDHNLSFRYFVLTDPLGKTWINGVFDKQTLQSIYESDGVVLYRRFADAETVANLLPELELLRVRKPEPDTLLRYDAEKVFDRVENFIPYCSSKLKDMVYGERAQKLASTAMGEEVSLLKDKINYKLPGCGEFVPHQDAAAGWQAYGDRQVTFALSFDIANEENGALFFARSEHKKGLFGPLKTPLSDECVRFLNWEVVPMAPGDVILFDAFTPHYSKSNFSDRMRQMAFLTYNPRRVGNFRESFFAEKRRRQPPIDERREDQNLVRDEFGKLVYQ